MTSPEPETPYQGEERAAYVALALIPGIGATRMRNLIQSSGSPSGALAAPLAFLEAIPEMKGTAAAVHRARIDAGYRVQDDVTRLGADAPAAGR